MSMLATSPPVPFHGFDLRYDGWADTLVDAVRDVAGSGEFILKARVAELEAAIAARVGVEHAVAVANGTGALVLALNALGLGPGDDVVTPAFSFISSASAIALTGARPVFADVDATTAMVTPATVEAALTPVTRAVLPVHLFNGCAPMAALMDQARGHGLAVVEDSAVSLGATVDGRPAGSHGDVAVLSFFPGKPLGGVGDGGMVLTDDAGLAAIARMRRNHGQDLTTRFLHHSIGWNCRMDEITAQFLLARLPHLDGWLARRRDIAVRYREAFAGFAPELTVPPGDFTGRSVYLYVIQCPRRDRLRTHLATAGIETGLYYPRPLHLQPVFAALGHREGDFPEAERLARETLALPLYPEMADAAVDRVIAAVTSFFGGRR